MAAAAQFYHQAAAASAAADPLSSCSQPGAASAGQPIPDIPRYPWMSITGECHLKV
jgi:Antp family protein